MGQTEIQKLMERAYHDIDTSELDFLKPPGLSSMTTENHDQEAPLPEHRDPLEELSVGGGSDGNPPSYDTEGTPSIMKFFLKQVLVLFVLVAITLGVMYGPMISNSVSFWWRKTRDPVVEKEGVNVLYPGSEAYFEMSDDERGHLPESIMPDDNRIVISKIEVNAPIVDATSTSDEDMLAAIQHGVAHYPGTADPGVDGNAFLTAHSSYWWWDKGEYKFVFQHLEDLVVGDVITIYYNQKRYDYTVRETKTVKPKGNHVDELFEQEAYRNDPILTLMTCTPVGTSLNRFIVIAEQTSPDILLNIDPWADDNGDMIPQINVNELY